MVDRKRAQQLKKEDIKKFIQAYILEYRTFLEENYPQSKNDFPLYAGYPFDVKAYVSEKSTHIVYKYNAPSLRIEVVGVNRVPDRKTVQENAIQGYSNAYLSLIINKPQDVARKDILAYEAHEREYEEQQEYYEQLYAEAEVDATINHYLKYLESAYNVKKKTSEEKRNEIYSAIKLVDEHRNYYDAYLRTGCENLFNVMFELNADIESSIFLSIHGKYRPANALLRRWLETTIHSLYSDFKLKRNNKNTKTYESTLEKRNEGLKKARRIPFTGDDGSILAQLIDSHTDNIATQLLKGNSYFSEQSFRKYVENLYRYLSNKYVHYGGTIPSEDELLLEFAEYNEKLFKEWYVNLNRINEICNILTLLKFPEMLTLYEEYKEERFPTLKEKQMRKLKELLKIK